MKTTPYEYSFRRGVLRRGAQVLPLPIAESYRLNMRCALAILIDYFADENACERRAWALHYQLGRRLTITEAWTMTPADLDDTVTDILVSGRKSEPFIIMAAQRRDQLRNLALSEHTYGRTVMSTYRRSSNSEFNFRLAKRMSDRKQSNVERSQANVDAWLKDVEEHRAKGEPTAFEEATQNTLGKFQNRSTAWWWYRIVREFSTQCGEKCGEFIMLRAGAVARLAQRIGKRKY
jgi:hypothetical protein